jgi:hypothetical protein
MKKYILMTAVFLAAGITGCKKNYLSQEVNPNQPSVTTPQLSLAGALVSTAAVISTNYNEYGVWAGYWTTSGNYVPNQSINEYQFTNSSFDTQIGGLWINLYSNLTNYNTLQTVSAASSSFAYFQAIAMIMKAYDFEQLVDNYNDVPYSQAFKPSSILFPAYDKASDIYHDLGKQLDAAIALINKNTAASNPGSSDIVFGGNMTSWKKFANSLKLRLAIHVSSAPAPLGASDPLVTDLASTAGEGYLDGSTEATANPGYIKALASSGATQQNPFWDTYGLDVNGNPPFNAVYWRANDFSVKFLQNTNDPRVYGFYAPTTGTWPAIVIRGNVFGDVSPNDQANPNTSGIGPGLLKSPSQNTVLFSGAESLFLQAEALLNGFITSASTTPYTTPQQLYEAGITASFVDAQAGGTYTPVPADNTGAPITAGQTPQTPDFVYTPPTAAASQALAVTYYSQNINNVGWAASPNKQQAIITQKWVALNGYFNLEAYNEYRRTGIPALPSSIDPAAISQTLPTRIFYPISELTSNQANLAKEPAVNPFTSKIFFAK